MTAIERHVMRGPRRFYREMRDGSRRQASVVFALIFKEFKNRAGRNSRLGMLWIVLDPITQVLVLSIMWLAIGRYVIDGVSVVLFIAVATAPYSIIAAGVGSIPRSLVQNRMFYSYQQVKPIDSVIAEFVLEMTLIAIGEFFLFFVLWWFFDLTILFGNILPILALIVLAMAASFGLALFVATYSAIYDNIPKMLGLVTRPLIFVSGVFYSASHLPASARQYLSWNPIIQIVEQVRHYAVGTKVFPEADIGYAMGFALTALFFGLAAYTVNRERFFAK